jgi:hypothetical protein
VLHRPIETARLLGNWLFRPKGQIPNFRESRLARKTGGLDFEFELWVPHPTHFVGWGFSICYSTPHHLKQNLHL